MHSVRLKPGKEKSLRRRHPWLFSGALKEPEIDIENGATVNIVSSSGEILARGAYSPHSQIRIRIWSFNPAENIDIKFFGYQIENAVNLRNRYIPPDYSAYRIINAESDGLPGLIVDRYADFLVCQFLSAGVEYFKEEIITELQRIFSPAGIYERSDLDVRLKEGLTHRAGILAGVEPPELIKVGQSSLKFLVDVRHGHKTGMYLDQNANRQVISRLAANLEILNCFAYTGGFTLAAMQGGAGQVTNIESSAEAIALFERQVKINRFNADNIENKKGDAFEILRKYRDSGKVFDMVILDPPKFVSSTQQIKRGCRGYKDINLLAIKLLRKNGLLITFSCSGHVSPELFQKVIADAALDAQREVKIIEILGQPIDHPTALNFPEGRYLKGLVCYVM